MTDLQQIKEYVNSELERYELLVGIMMKVDEIQWLIKEVERLQESWEKLARWHMNMKDAPEHDEDYKAFVEKELKEIDLFLQGVNE